MKDLECNCSWHFAKFGDDSQKVGPNNAASEHFNETPYPSLIRESIQNSLDVVLDTSKPLRMRFEFGKLRGSTYKGFYGLRNHIAGVISYFKQKAKPQYEDMLKCFDNIYNHQESIWYIKVSDFNTKGMDYKQDDSPFDAFVRSIGLTVKDDESSGGSFGFGKAAYFLMSPIHTILVSTKTQEGKTFFEGAASLCTHLCEDEKGNKVKYQHYGFYDNQDGTRPATLQTDIPGRFSRDETGTDIYIMGVDASSKKQEEAYKEMITAALRHFWLAFMDKKLEVEIETTRIDAQNLDELMCKYFPTQTDKARNGDEYNPRPYYEAVKNANSNPNFIQVDKILTQLGAVRLYVWKNKEARDSIIYMRKQRMYIYRSQKNSGSYGYVGVFLCTDSNGNKLLKSIEDPSHKKWDKRRNKQQGKLIVEEMETFVEESLQDIFASQPGGSLGIVGLEDWLFIPENLIGSNRDNVKDNPFFGEPSENEQEEGTSPISSIQSLEPNQNSNENETIGKVVTVVRELAGTKKGTELGRHVRGNGEKKRGSGGSPGTSGVSSAEDGSATDVKYNLPVRYRVMAQKRLDRMVHSILIHTDTDVEHGEIEIIVGGEEYDEPVDIVSSSMGHVNGNTVTNLKLYAGCKNMIDIRFADNMKHTIKLAAYEFK